MNKADFFRNLVEYSQAKDFSFLIAGDVTQAPRQVSRGQQLALSALSTVVGGAIGGGFGLAGVVGGGALFGAGFGVPGYSNARKQELISDLQRLSPYGDLVGINLTKGFALLRVAIDADDLTEDALVGRFSLIHQRAFKFRKYALSTFPSNMGALVEVLVIFSAHERVRDFIQRVAPKCKHNAGFISRMRGGVHTYPWVVDLECKEIVGTRMGLFKLAFGLERGDHNAALFRQRE